MNTRIAELVAAEMAEYYEGAYQDSACAKDQLARFAELIVRDCACVPTDMWGRGELPADQASRVQRRILAHFGVQ